MDTKDTVLAALVVLLCSAIASWPAAATQASATGLRFVTSDPSAIDYWPSFSPDGKAVLFSRTTDGRMTWGLQLVPSAGGEVQRLPGEGFPPQATRASWSARRNEIAFTGTAGGQSTVWLVRPDGTGLRQLAVPGVSARLFYPSWYPDGSSLAVMEGQAFVTRRIDLEALSATTVTNHDQVLTGMPSVSPDGKWVAFAGQANRGQPYDQTNNVIWIVGESGVAEPLEAAPRQGRAPSWSPDGTMLVFESNRDSSSPQLYAVFLINRDGTGVRRLTDYDSNANHPVFSPDGTRLVVSARHTKGINATGIAIIDLSTR